MSWAKSSHSDSGNCLEWMFRKSSHSASGSCAEAALRDSQVLVRDSQLGEDSPVLSFSSAEWTRFLATLR